MKALKISPTPVAFTNKIVAWQIRKFLISSPVMTWGEYMFCSKLLHSGKDPGFSLAQRVAAPVRREFCGCICTARSGELDLEPMLVLRQGSGRWRPGGSRRPADRPLERAWSHFSPFSGLPTLPTGRFSGCSAAPGAVPAGGLRPVAIGRCRNARRLFIDRRVPSRGRTFGVVVTENLRDTAAAAWVGILPGDDANGIYIQYQARTIDSDRQVNPPAASPGELAGPFPSAGQRTWQS